MKKASNIKDIYNCDSSDTTQSANTVCEKSEQTRLNPVNMCDIQTGG